MLSVISFSARPDSPAPQINWSMTKEEEEALASAVLPPNGELEAVTELHGVTKHSEDQHNNAYPSPPHETTLEDFKQQYGYNTIETDTDLCLSNIQGFMQSRTAVLTSLQSLYASLSRQDNSPEDQQMLGSQWTATVNHVEALDLDINRLRFHLLGLQRSFENLREVFLHSLHSAFVPTIDQYLENINAVLTTYPEQPIQAADPNWERRWVPWNEDYNRDAAVAAQRFMPDPRFHSAEMSWQMVQPPPQTAARPRRQSAPSPRFDLIPPRAETRRTTSLRAAANRVVRTAKVTELRCDQDLQLGRVWADDEANNYVTMLPEYLPYIQDPNYQVCQDEQAITYVPTFQTMSMPGAPLLAIAGASAPTAIDARLHAMLPHREDAPEPQMQVMAVDQPAAPTQAPAQAQTPRQWNQAGLLPHRENAPEPHMMLVDPPAPAQAIRQWNHAGLLPPGILAEPSSPTKEHRNEVDLSILSKPFSTASTIKARYISIGTWSEDTSGDWDIIAKFHHSKKHLVWQLKDSKQHYRLQIAYADVSALTVHDVSIPGSESNNPFILLTFYLNALPTVCQEVASRDHRHSKAWAKIDATTTPMNDAAVLPQIHRLVLDKRTFMDRTGNGISQYERLILGDPYFARIARVDVAYGPLADGFFIKNRRTMELLRDKLFNFFLTLHNMVEYYSLGQMSMSVNYNVHHTFKAADSFRLTSKPHQNAIAVNFEDAHKIAMKWRELARQHHQTVAAMQQHGPYRRGLHMPGGLVHDKVLQFAAMDFITRDEIQYFTQVTKIGENGICSFRNYGVSPVVDAEGKLDVDRLVPRKKFVVSGGEAAPDAPEAAMDANGYAMNAMPAVMNGVSGRYAAPHELITSASPSNVDYNGAQPHVMPTQPEPFHPLLGPAYQEAAQPDQVASPVFTAPEPFSAPRTPVHTSRRHSTGSAGKKRRNSKSGHDNGKNIRVAMMFAKSRLLAICGPSIMELWDESTLLDK